MNRILLLVVVVALLLATLAVVYRPRSMVIAGSVQATARSNQTASPGATETVERSAPQLIVRVDGEEVVAPALMGARPLAELPVEQLASSQVSHVRANGRSQVLVLIDGSELLLDVYTRDRLAPDIAYRATYERTAGGG